METKDAMKTKGLLPRLAAALDRLRADLRESNGKSAVVYVHDLETLIAAVCGAGPWLDIAPEHRDAVAAFIVACDNNAALANVKARVDADLGARK